LIFEKEGKGNGLTRCKTARVSTVHEVFSDSFIELIQHVAWKSLFPYNFLRDNWGVAIYHLCYEVGSREEIDGCCWRTEINYGERTHTAICLTTGRSGFIIQGTNK
jgi:hypothetical protein